MFKVYEELLEKNMAVPTFTGKKPERRKFAGAEYTLALETMMKNCKSVQAATSHNLGQHFSKAFDLTYSVDGKKEYIYQSCAGVTTRMLGIIAMVHGDDKGLVLPPKVAPYSVAFIGKNSEIQNIKENFTTKTIEKLDDAIVKGFPLIIDGKKILIRHNMQEVEIENNLSTQINNLLDKIQDDMFIKASKFKDEHTIEPKDYVEMTAHISEQKGFCKVTWCGDDQCSRKIRKETLGSLRIINDLNDDSKCIHCGQDGKYVAIFGQSY